MAALTSNRDLSGDLYMGKKFYRTHLELFMKQKSKMNALTKGKHE